MLDNVNLSVFCDPEAHVAHENLIHKMVDAYTFAIGMIDAKEDMEDFNLDMTPVGRILRDNEMNNIAIRAEDMLHSWYKDENLWSVEEVDALLPELSSLITYLTPEGESLYPEMDLIEEISKEEENDELWQNLVSDWLAIRGAEPTEKTIMEAFAVIMILYNNEDLRGLWLGLRTTNSPQVAASKLVIYVENMLPPEELEDDDDDDFYY